MMLMKHIDIQQLQSITPAKLIHLAYLVNDGLDVPSFPLVCKILAQVLHQVCLECKAAVAQGRANQTCPLLQQNAKIRLLRNSTCSSKYSSFSKLCPSGRSPQSEIPQSLSLQGHCTSSQLQRIILAAPPIMPI